MRSIRMLSALIARHRSSASPVTRLYFTPASGRNSNVVTTGPGLIRTICPRTSNSAHFSTSVCASSRSTSSRTICAIVAPMQQGTRRQPEPTHDSSAPPSPHGAASNIRPRLESQSTGQPPPCEPQAGAAAGPGFNHLFNPQFLHRQRLAHRLRIGNHRMRHLVPQSLRSRSRHTNPQIRHAAAGRQNRPHPHPEQPQQQKQPRSPQNPHRAVPSSAPSSLQPCESWPVPSREPSPATHLGPKLPCLRCAQTASSDSGRATQRGKQTEPPSTPARS